MKRREPNRKANICVARSIPILLLGILGYSSWVLTKLVCVDYLLNPNPNLLLRPRNGAAIAILIVYYILLLVLLICYGRLVQTVVANPGLVPRGPQFFVERDRKARSKRRKRRRQDITNKESALDADSAEGVELRSARRNYKEEEEGSHVGDFWQKDVFVCNYDGRPRFCSTCYNYKPDRAHHCSELDRCVYKMDHFCPWVGGIVSEESFKYFIQFTFWTGILTLHVLVVMAYYFAERRRRENFINVHWILVLAFAALFLIFGAGMCMSSLQFAFLNTTTIENLTRKSKVYYLATYVSESVLQRMNSSTRENLRLITYPRPPSEQLQILQNSGADIQQNQSDQNSNPPSNPLNQTHSNRLPNAPTAVTTATNNLPPMIRTFAILETKPGQNPFDVGYFNNFKEVLGYHPVDWFFPIHPSPLTNHDAPESMYRFGRVLYELRKDAGILNDEELRRSPSSRRRRRRRRRRSEKTADRASTNTDARE